MRALLVYESMFGNTRTIAEAIADGVGKHCMVETVEVSNAPLVIGGDFDLIIAGGPTHVFGMSRPASRSDAAQQAERPLVSRSIGIREWLDEVSLEGIAAAATFDTRMASPRWLHILGSAAGKIERRMKQHGFIVVARGEHFHVSGIQGPLVAGEIGRAREWGYTVATTLVAPSPVLQPA